MPVCRRARPSGQTEGREKEVGPMAGAVYVLCVRQDQIPAGRVIPPGVKARLCAGCGARCWLSLSSRRLVEREGAKPRCDRCIPAGRPLAVARTAEGEAEMRAYCTAERN
jgi:hypothetical protein